ncbi:MAG: glycosyltransferase [Actinomycetota bacterium]
MALLQHVPVGSFDPRRFESVLSAEQFERFEQVIDHSQDLFEGRILFNVNSTAKGGGVAEMLRSLLAYARGSGINARWIVIQGNNDFFAVTKRIHNHLHGAPGDGGPLGDAERKVYESLLERNAEELADRVRPEDVVMLHDPQTAGLVTPLKQKGATVLWRCHVGLDVPNELARGAWRFLIPYVTEADGYVFSRRAFAWEDLDTDRISIVPPSIDAFSPKNQEMKPETVDAIVKISGLTAGKPSNRRRRTFTREDGSPGRVDRRVEFYDEAEPPPPDAPLVVQVSRWDRLKDPLGVIEGFAEHVAPDTEAHLIVAGPAVEAVADDPEGKQVLEEARAAWDRLPGAAKSRIHLACLPMYDGEENAAIVNALQRRADVVVQKSLAEGFGLTVAEAMWKGRPVVASRIGGIQDQVTDGDTGLLIDDPLDLAAYGKAVRDLLSDPDRARGMGRAAQERIRADFLGPRHLTQYVDLIETLID